jgi:type II secretory pathway component GspD/PulD (secretin)
VVDMLDELYVQEANRTRGDGAVRVTADPELNAVLVSAPAADIEVIRGLIEQIEGQTPSRILEIRQIALTSANAIETVRLIETVLEGRSLGPRRRADVATVIRYFSQMAGEGGGEAGAEGEGVEISTAIRESITLTPDVRTNSIIVTAPPRRSR